MLQPLTIAFSLEFLALSRDDERVRASPACVRLKEDCIKIHVRMRYVLKRYQIRDLYRPVGCFRLDRLTEAARPVESHRPQAMGW